MRTALGFYEDDEDPDVIRAAFDAGEMRLTVQPSTSSSATQTYVEWTS